MFAMNESRQQAAAVFMSVLRDMVAEVPATLVGLPKPLTKRWIEAQINSNYFDVNRLKYFYAKLQETGHYLLIEPQRGRKANPQEGEYWVEYLRQQDCQVEHRQMWIGNYPYGLSYQITYQHLTVMVYEIDF